MFGVAFLQSQIDPLRNQKAIRTGKRQDYRQYWRRIRTAIYVHAWCVDRLSAGDRGTSLGAYRFVFPRRKLRRGASDDPHDHVARPQLDGRLRDRCVALDVQLHRYRPTLRPSLLGSRHGTCSMKELLTILISTICTRKRVGTLSTSSKIMNLPTEALEGWHDQRPQVRCDAGRTPVRALTGKGRTY